MLKSLATVLFALGFFLIPACIFMAYVDFRDGKVFSFIWDLVLFGVNVWSVQLNYRTAFK